MNIHQFVNIDAQMFSHHSGVLVPEPIKIFDIIASFDQLQYSFHFVQMITYLNIHFVSSNLMLFLLIMINIIVV